MKFLLAVLITSWVAATVGCDRSRSDASGDPATPGDPGALGDGARGDRAFDPGCSDFENCCPDYETICL